MTGSVVSVTVSTGWKEGALAIGFGAIALLWAMLAFSNRTVGWRVWRIVDGTDGVPSTSLFQWFFWLLAIIFAYVVLWVLRASSGDYGAISELPRNLLTMIGLSTGTAVGAKGITVGYLNSGRIAKTPAWQSSPGGILQDDNGQPEIAKIQLVAFTVIAIGIFLATLVHQILAHPAVTTLPNIDTSLLALMGISQGGYLGKKIVSVGPVPSSGAG